MNSLKDFLAVVVLYKCDINMSTSLTTLNDSVKCLGKLRLDVVVYDNSEQPEESMNLNIFPHLSLVYKNDKSNPGVSTAYNFGARKAKKLNKKWLIIFDQDTQIAIDYLYQLLHSINIYPNEYLFTPRLIQGDKLLSPCKYKFKRGSTLKNLQNGIVELKGKNLLNSGIAIDLTLFDKVNGYTEDVRLYFSDFIFFDKLRKYIQTFVLMDVVLHHSMSSNNESDLESFYYRFSLYCIGAKEASKYSNIFGKISYYSISLTRAFKLAIKLKDYRYLSLWMKRNINNLSTLK